MVPVLSNLLFFLVFVSAGLSWYVASLMFVSYRTLRKEYLLGFPFGFKVVKGFRSQ
jgi:hypothetical protein